MWEMWVRDNRASSGVAGSKMLEELEDGVVDGCVAGGRYSMGKVCRCRRTVGSKGEPAKGCKKTTVHMVRGKG